MRDRDSLKKRAPSPPISCEHLVSQEHSHGRLQAESGNGRQPVHGPRGRRDAVCARDDRHRPLSAGDLQGQPDRRVAIRHPHVHARNRHRRPGHRVLVQRSRDWRWCPAGGVCQQHAARSRVGAGTLPTLSNPHAGVVMRRCALFTLWMLTIAVPSYASPQLPPLLPVECDRLIELLLATTAPDDRRRVAEALVDMTSHTQCLADAMMQRAAFPAFIKLLETLRTDKQSGASSGTGGSTNLVSKGTTAKILSVAAEYGALTETVNKQ